MTEWIDVAVYAALIAVVWGWVPASSARSTLLVIGERNPAWLASHPDVATRLANGRWFIASGLAWGAFSLACLLAVQSGVWPRSWLPRDTPTWVVLKELNSVLLIAGLVYLAACGVAFSRWLHAHVPLAPSRRATLVRRSIGDFVPPALQYAIYGVVALHLALWVAVAATNDNVAVVWASVAFQFAMSGVFLAIVRGAVRRRPSAMDRIFGPAYRRAEVRLAFAAQLLPLVNGAARLYEQIGNATPDVVDRVAHLGTVGVIVALATFVIVWARQRGNGGSVSSSHAVRSSGAFGLSESRPIDP